MGRHLSERSRQIRELHQKGLKRREIAAQLSVSVNVIRQAVEQGREVGALEPFRPKIKERCQEYIRRRNLRLGSVNDVLSALSENQILWLINKTQKAEEETIAGYLLELVRDAHASATGAAKSNIKH
ncbi:hypothetical protein [Marivivens aquimaris]|uniref:hypothetical protein n=1 Tax=Marivivens aquimaris TaxID=2774876 RepID=UPI00187EA975|nr:hypothetical protein [Marivivens aquimaris]